MKTEKWDAWLGSAPVKMVARDREDFSDYKAASKSEGTFQHPHIFIGGGKEEKTHLDVYSGGATVDTITDGTFCVGTFVGGATGTMLPMGSAQQAGALPIEDRVSSVQSTIQSGSLAIATDQRGSVGYYRRYDGPSPSTA